jgi:hypothetical protein
MASEDKAPTGPDLSKGLPGANLPEGAMAVGRVGDDEVLLVRKNGHCMRFPLIARITMGHWRMGCWSVRRFAARGITHISVSRPAKRLQRPRSARSPAGRSRSVTARSSSKAKNSTCAKDDRVGKRAHCHCRWRRCRICRCGNAAPPWLRGAYHYAEQRRCSPCRPPEFVERLSRGQRS